MSYTNRDVENKHRRKIKIVSQSENEIIADIERYEGNVIDEGTQINAELFINIENSLNEIKNSVETASQLVKANETKSNEAYVNANSAKANAEDAKEKAENARILAQTAKTSADQALSNIVAAQGTKIYLGNSVTPVGDVSFSSDPQSQITQNKDRCDALAIRIDSNEISLSNHSGEITTIKQTFLPLTGGTLTGTLTIPTLNVTTINIL